MNQSTHHLDSLLQAVARRLILRAALSAAADLAVILLPLTISLACIDYILRPGSTGRLAEGISILVALAAISARHFFRAANLHSRTTLAATTIERLVPGFGGRLLSYVDFRSRPPVASAATVSPSVELIEAMTRRLEKQAASLDPRRLVPFEPLGARLGLACALLILAGGLLTLHPRGAATWAARTFHPFHATSWPARTQIAGIAREYHVRRGETLQLTGNLVGRIEPECEMTVQPIAAGAPTARIDILAVKADGQFAARVGPIVVSTQVRIRAGDAPATTSRIEPTDPPAIQDIAIRCRYPDYLGGQVDQPASRDLRAPVGTRIDLAVTADKPVRAMTLILMQQGTESRERFEPISGLQAKSAFTVRSSGWYGIQLEDSTGVGQDKPPTYTINAIENPRATVQLEYPTHDLTVTPGAVLPLRFEASDDHGVVAAGIVWRLRKAASPTVETVSRTPIQVEPPMREWQGRLSWNLAETGAQPGDRILFHVEVADAGEHIEAPKSGEEKTASRSLRIVDADTYLREHLARLSASRRDIDRLPGQVSASWDELSSIDRSLRSEQLSRSPEAVARLKAESRRQKELASQVDALADRLHSLADEWSISIPATSARPEGTRLLARTLAHIAAGPLHDAFTALEATPARCETPTDKIEVLAQLTKARNAQAETLRLLARIASTKGLRQAGADGERKGPATTMPTTDDFAQAQQTLAAGLKNALGPIELLDKGAANSQPRKPGDERTISGPRGGGPARNARETQIVGGPTRTLPPAVTTGPTTNPPWTWNLPPQARAVLQQASAEPFPPRQAEAIRRYYERLSSELGKQP